IWRLSSSSLRVSLGALLAFGLGHFLKLEALVRRFLLFGRLLEGMGGLEGGVARGLVERDRGERIVAFLALAALGVEEVADGREARGGEGGGCRGVEARNLRERRSPALRDEEHPLESLGDLGLDGLLALDLDAGADQSRCEADILSPLSDGER